MKNSKKVESDDFDDIRRARLSAEEISDQDGRIDSEVSMLRDIQESLSKEVARYMVREDIGIVELTRRLATSSRQTNRIMKGEENLTLATVTEIASLMGTKVRIVFDPVVPKQKKTA